MWYVISNRYVAQSCELDRFLREFKFEFKFTKYFQVRVQKILFFEFEFGKNDRCQRVRVRSPATKCMESATCSAVSTPKLQICNHLIYNKKIKSKVCFERFESINLKHSVSELELDCCCFEFEFKKFYFSSLSSSSAKTIEFSEFKFKVAALHCSWQAIYAIFHDRIWRENSWNELNA